MMEDWRIRNNSRFHVPPGILRRRANEDGEERYWENAPTYRCFSSPSLAKLLFAMILLSILFTTTVPSFQTWELGHLRLWRWQLVAFFAFYGRFISRAITNGVLHVIENSNDARLKGNLPHAYAVKRTFEYLLSFAILLTAWILLIEGIPLKKLGRVDFVSQAKLFGTNQRGCLFPVHLAYHVNSIEGFESDDRGERGYRRCCPEQSKGTQAFTRPDDLLSMASRERRHLDDWGVWNMVNIVRNAHALDETLRLLPHRRSTRPNLNTWDDKAMSVSEEIIKKVSKSESREISLEELSYCMPKAIAEEALKRIGATQGKFGIDELFIWMVECIFCQLYPEQADELSENSAAWPQAINNKAARHKFLLSRYLVARNSRTFQQHKGLKLSLDDSHRILRDLHHAVGVVVLAIFSIAWLVILDTVYVLPKDKESGQKAYILILFLALAVAYVFHVVWEKDGDGVRFFFRHQIQVGETCTIDGDTMQVEELRIYHTVFLNTVGHKMFCPNYKLRAGEGNFR
ncbi:hypothetical protein RHSIM_Rhsim05G0027400 [Rhododendron simsii]|uniref:Uncharacterized protein n=1 Tax=Rhododendron simsii TaxID=118357 RepID=A0A834LPS9_RHOSS|nr:hypothetical protein RHSIM_Rhsim05G0027400 [Rhododendron simsii]